MDKSKKSKYRLAVFDGKTLEFYGYIGQASNSCDSTNNKLLVGNVVKVYDDNKYLGETLIGVDPKGVTITTLPMPDRFNNIVWLRYKNYKSNKELAGLVIDNLVVLPCRTIKKKLFGGYE